jgi:signal peptidase II
VSPADAAAAPDELAASDHPGAALLLTRFGWVALLVALDLWSKAAVFAWLTPLGARGELPPHPCGLLGHAPRYPLAGDWLGFMLSRNAGAAFGKLGDMPYLLVGGRVVAVLFVTWLILRASPKKPWVTAAFVLILGGALGNVYDNLWLAESGSGHPFGLVRDFIDVYFGFADWHFPTFNVADSCISVGAAILVVNGLFGHHKKPEPAPAG